MGAGTDPISWHNALSNYKVQTRFGTVKWSLLMTSPFKGEHSGHVYTAIKNPQP